jgi:hypothetical protein
VGQTGLMVNLVRLRYRLLWAKVRSRNGKIALFFVGYLFAVLIIVLLALGGFGAALAAIRLGRAELVARILLGGFYLNAILASVVLGIGVNQSFSDAALRRYPLSGVERLTARHVVAFLEPLWMFALALDLGLATGFSLVGAAPLWLALPAAVLLVITNYLLARVLVGLVERAISTRTGPVLLFILSWSVVAMPALFRNQGFVAAALIVFKGTPPSAAAAVIGGAGGLSAVAWVLLLVGWCLGLTAALAALEGRPAPSRALAGAEATWDHPCDRIAALFGSGAAPLAGKMLRYYIRSPQVRYSYPSALLMLVVLSVTHSRGQPATAFPFALSAMLCVAGLCAGSLPLNVFGFDGPGFRRYFLLPVAPAVVLRTAGLIALIPGATLIPGALLLWLVFSPVPSDARMVSMLLFSASTGLLVFQALGIWTSLLAPRPIEFTAIFGNSLSLAANVLILGNIAVLFSLTLGLSAIGTTLLLRYWWTTPLLMVAAAGFFGLTLRAGTAWLVARRERMLFLIEGRG